MTPGPGTEPGSTPPTDEPAALRQHWMNHCGVPLKRRRLRRCFQGGGKGDTDPASPGCTGKVNKAGSGVLLDIMIPAGATGGRMAFKWILINSKGL